MLKRKPEIFEPHWLRVLAQLHATRNTHDFANLLQVHGRPLVGLEPTDLIEEAKAVLDRLASTGELRLDSPGQPFTYWGIAGIQNLRFTLLAPFDVGTTARSATVVGRGPVVFNAGEVHMGGSATPIGEQKIDLSAEIAAIQAIRSGLGFMRQASARLRVVVMRDLDELDGALRGGHHKTALLLIGSLLEAMLIDVLDRRRDLASSHMQKKQKFPDDASLGDLIRIAGAEPGGRTLLSTSASGLSHAVREHRDLIHPNREVSGNIVVDEATAHAMVSLLRLVVRDLSDAHRDGVIAEYEGK